MQAVLLTLQKWLSLCTWTLQGILCHKNICHSIMLRLFRPDRHIPLHSGPPAAYPAGSRQQLYTVPPTYQPHFSNTRTHTCGELLEGFGMVNHLIPRCNLAMMLLWSTHFWHPKTWQIWMTKSCSSIWANGEGGQGSSSSSRGGGDNQMLSSMAITFAFAHQFSIYWSALR